MRKEERLIVEVPEWALEGDAKFFAFWTAFWGERGAELTRWLDEEKTLVFTREGETEWLPAKST